MEGGPGRSLNEVRWRLGRQARHACTLTRHLDPTRTVLSEEGQPLVPECSAR